MGAGLLIVPLIAVFLAASAATLWLLKIRLPRDEAAAGVTALAGMRWRDFINVVLAALEQRGYTRVFEEDGARDDSEYILERAGRRWLLSCKHGSAFVLGPAAVVDMGNAIRLNNLAGGLLLTQGRISNDARPIAALQHVELLDNRTLWPELRGLMPPGQRAEIEAEARKRARKQVLLVWLVATLLAIMAALGLRAGHADGEAMQAANTAAVASDDVGAPATAAARAPAADHPGIPVSTAQADLAEAAAPRAPVMPTPSDPASGATAPETVATANPTAVAADRLPVPTTASTDPLVLERQRAAIADALATLSSVDRAIWATQSTLQVHLSGATVDARRDLCPLVERYPSLASSRLQITPAPGSDAPVRFVQCRTY